MEHTEHIVLSVATFPVVVQSHAIFSHKARPDLQWYAQRQKLGVPIRKQSQQCPTIDPIASVDPCSADSEIKVRSDSKESFNFLMFTLR